MMTDILEIGCHAVLAQVLLLASLPLCVLASEPSEKSVVAEEPGKIAAMHGRVRREGRSLVIRTVQGNPVILSDGRCEHDDGGVDFEHCVSYVLADYSLRHHGFLILAFYYENSGYVWVDDRSGEATAIAGRPHFSPSGRRFVAARAAELGYNGIQVWGIRSGKLALDWEYQPTGYALYEFKGWQGEDKVLLGMTTWVDHKLVEGLPARLVRTSSGWTLEAPRESSR